MSHKKYLFLFIIFFISSCTSSQQLVLPSGQKGFTVSCGGTANSWSSCYKKAGEICPIGYNILDQNSERVVILNAPGINRTLIISCK